MDAISAGRMDFANTLTSLGFLPPWYVAEMRSNSSYRGGNGGGGGGAAPVKGSGGVGGATAAEAYGSTATAAGAPDEFSGNSRMIKAALCAGEELGRGWGGVGRHQGVWLVGGCVVGVNTGSVP